MKIGFRLTGAIYVKFYYTAPNHGFPMFLRHYCSVKFRVRARYNRFILIFNVICTFMCFIYKTFGKEREREREWERERKRERERAFSYCLNEWNKLKKHKLNSSNNYIDIVSVHNLIPISNWIYWIKVINQKTSS